MAEIVLLQRDRRLRRQRANIEFQMLKRANPFDLKDNLFLRKYRLSKESVQALCSLLYEEMDKKTNGYSVELQVLASLRLLGSGSFQNVISESMFTFMSQATCSRIFTAFLNAALKLVKDFIFFPKDSQTIVEKKMKFFALSGYPNVVGAIDGTHVTICKPSQSDWFVFLNRHNKFSLNVQVICDAEMKFTNVVAKWPGSTHDSFIYQNCSIKPILREMARTSQNLVIGDSGYPLEPWLMVPFLRPASRQEIKFNKVHRSSRSVVERAIGTWKRRFRLIDQSGGLMLYSPVKCAKIVMVTAMLHNLCQQYGVQLPDDVSDFVDDSPPSSPYLGNNDMRRFGEIVRSNIARNL